LGCGSAGRWESRAKTFEIVQKGRVFARISCKFEHELGIFTRLQPRGCKRFAGFEAVSGSAKPARPLGLRTSENSIMNQYTMRLRVSLRLTRAATLPHVSRDTKQEQMALSGPSTPEFFIHFRPKRKKMALEAHAEAQ
jgi:hypothetical protein